MEFLQHSYRRAREQISHKANSNPREKEKHKIQRVQEEIVGFFQAKRPALEGTDLNITDLRLSKDQDKNSIYSSRQDNSYQHQRNNRLRSSSHDLLTLVMQRIPEGANHGDRSLHRESSSRRISPPLNQPRTMADSSSKRSDKARSDISSSEPDYNLASGTNLQAFVSQSLGSPIPDSVRQSIERTGIFNDTGIDISGRLRDSEELKSPRAPGIMMPKVADGLSTYRNVTAPGSASPKIQSPTLLRHHGNSHVHSTVQHEKSFELDDQTYNNRSKYASMSIPIEKTKERPDQGIGNRLEQHFDPQLEWHQDSYAHIQQPIGNQCKTQGSKLTLDERARLAKKARLRFPPLPLSVSRVAGGEPHKVGANQQITSAAPGPEDKAANRTLGNQGDFYSVRSKAQDMHADEGKAQAGGDFPSGQAIQDPQFSERSVDNIIHEVLTQQTLQPRLQTPASVRSNLRADLPQINCISHFCLPVRRPSVISRTYSPAMARPRLTPITEPDPLFLRQLNEQNRGEGELCHEPRSHEEPFVHLRPRNFKYFTSIYDECMEPHKGQAVEDECIVDSYDPNPRPYQPYSTHKNLQLFDSHQADPSAKHRHWYLDLNPNHEHSEECEDAYDYCNYNRNAEIDNDMIHEVHYEKEAKSFGCDVRRSRNSVSNQNERGLDFNFDIKRIDQSFSKTEGTDQMSDFWRPHPHY
jgi:hypothetical protein